ncbi:urease accessory protein, partial [Prosthecomicrobium hirschii]
AGAIAFATLLYAAPDADRHLDRLRGLVDDDAREPTVEAGTSAFDGFLVARFLSPSPQALRRDLVRILEAFRGRPMPRPWSC